MSVVTFNLTSSITTSDRSGASEGLGLKEKFVFYMNSNRSQLVIESKRRWNSVMISGFLRRLGGEDDIISY